jgi:hypothetical protein
MFFLVLVTVALSYQLFVQLILQIEWRDLKRDITRVMQVRSQGAETERQLYKVREAAFEAMVNHAMRWRRESEHTQYERPREMDGEL